MEATCIYCKNRFDSSHSSVEHIIPEGLGNKKLLLPKEAVCPSCNNEILSQLDNALLQFAPIKWMRSLKGIRSKKGRLKAMKSMQADIKPKKGNHIKINIHDEGVYRRTESGFTLKMRADAPTGETELEMVSRSLLKQALGFMYLHHGYDFVMKDEFDDLRSAILEGGYYGLIGLDGVPKESMMNRVTYKFIKPNKALPVVIVGNYHGVEISTIFPCVLTDEEEDKAKNHATGTAIFFGK